MHFEALRDTSIALTEKRGKLYEKVASELRKEPRSHRGNYCDRPIPHFKFFLLPRIPLAFCLVLTAPFLRTLPRVASGLRVDKVHFQIPAS